jgi:hypothetical protein
VCSVSRRNGIGFPDVHLITAGAEIARS